MHHTIRLHARAGLLLVSLALAGGVHAQLYKSVDADGNVVYSDVPPNEDAEPIELPPINVIEAVKVAPRQGEEVDTSLPAYTYSINIVQPQPEQTFQNTREFPVSVSLEPPLQPGHQVAISVDGVVKTRGEGLTTVVKDVERGEHRVTAAVVDASGKPISTSGVVVVYIQRRSLLLQ